MLTAADSAAVLADLRRTRRRQRVAAIHWVDALYQVYITGLLSLVAVVALSGIIGGDKVSAQTVQDVRDHGAAVVGTLAAVAVFMGLRSGSRGGPLALERADVRHVLLSPVDRGVALRSPAWRQLRFLVFAGAVVGAVAGQLALRRLPGNPAEWIAVGALFGVTLVALFFGCALLASGTKTPSWLSTLVGGVLVAWSVGDATGRAPTAPATLVGTLAIWPLHFDPAGLIGPILGLGLVAVGMRLVAGTSLEAAERRTALVGQLRFAVTLQDLRTVLVLRRQLAQERPRPRPWVPALRHHPRFPVLQRGVRSVARWPASRLVRILVLASVAGISLRAVWSGSTPMIVVAGLALWIAALDAAEPLGQEVDHPGRTDGFPMERGELYLKHLPVVLVASAVTGVLAAVVALVPVGSPVPAAVALLTGAAAGTLAACGAVVSVVQGAPDAVDVLGITTPEIAGFRTVFRTAWPPGMAVLGVLPLLAARAAHLGVSDPPPLTAAFGVVIPLSIVVVVFAGWVRFRDAVHEFLRNASEQMSPSAVLEKAAAEREAAEQREREQLAESRRIAGQDDDASDDDEDGEDLDVEPGADRPKAAAGPRPKPKKPPLADPSPGVQGGSSAKPIGRRRDQKP